MSMACVAFLRMSGLSMNVYRAKAVAPDRANDMGMARYGEASHTWIVASDTYTPMVAKEACAKFGTRVVRYVSVSPRLSRASRLANITASVYIGSIDNYGTRLRARPTVQTATTAAHAAASSFKGGVPKRRRRRRLN